jgi:3-oxoadipate enol-lactonase
MQARINDLFVHYEISGQGPWLTLSHSLATTMEMWQPQLQRLNPHFTVLRYDTRGHGLTSAPPAPYTLEQLADDAQALLAHLGVARTHWLGLSMGGMIGQTLAIRHPQLLHRVVLADTTGQVPAAAAQLWADRVRTARGQGMGALVQPTLSRWFTDPYRAAQPALMASIGAMISGTTVEGYAGCCAAIASTNTLEALKQQRLPALVIVGDQDQATPPAAAQALASHWPGARLVVLPGAAHLANIEQAGAFNDAVVGFLTARAGA